MKTVVLIILLALVFSGAAERLDRAFNEAPGLHGEREWFVIAVAAMILIWAVWQWKLQQQRVRAPRLH